MKYLFSKEQVHMLEQIGFSFDVTADLSDEQALEVEDAVSEYFSQRGLSGAGDTLSDIGVMCGDIMNELARE